LAGGSRIYRLTLIGVGEPMPLSDLVNRYVEHCEDIMGQILMRG
jgi:hypothetical protein